ETSTTSITVSSRSSVNTFTWASFIRAVTFQSMTRISSPGWYWRTSENAIPRPLNTEWYWPASTSETTLRVVISSLRIRRMSSLGSMGLSEPPRLRDLDLVEDALDDLLRGELFGLGLVGER